MDDRMRQEAEMAARLLLQYFRKEHPYWRDDKTPVHTIAAWLGMHIANFHVSDHPEGTYGYVDPDLDEHLIWLRGDLSELFRRFTLAHELGHVVLHCRRGPHVEAILQEVAASLPLSRQRPNAEAPELSREDPCYEKDIQEGNTGLLDEEHYQEVLGIGHSYDPRSQREIAANIFAAELLMPTQRIHTLYIEQRIPAHVLSEQFGVSSTALLNRLAGLLKAALSIAQPAFAQVARTSQEPAQTPLLPSKRQYDEFQQAAIETSTPALITAGPGSGKTSTLIGRIEYMVATMGIEPPHILALTFSRKAAQEMEERLQQALHSDNLPKVSTFHAFCADLLRQHGELVGLRPDFALIDDAEGYFVLRQLANQLPLRHYQNLHMPTLYFPDMLKAISRAKDELIPPEQYKQLAQHMLIQAQSTQDEEAILKAEKAMEIADIYRLYENALRLRGDSDFGGLLMLAIRLLQEQPEVLHAQQEQYQHILVDEFQDMNRASGVLLRVLAGKARRVWVVGDSNQAIYAFRGASPANIGNFEADFPGATILPLSRNYRSRPDLVALAESFRCRQLELGEEAGKNQPIRLAHPETYVTLAKAANEASELQGIIQDIRAKHASGYAYKDMVVLCRTRTLAQKITHALITADLPVIERSGMLEQEHIKDILCVLLLLSDETGMGLMRATRQEEQPLSQHDIEQFLLAARQQGLKADQLLARKEFPATISSKGQDTLTQLAETLAHLRHNNTVWSLLAHYLLLDNNRVRHLLSSEESKQRTALLADYDALLQLARHYDQQQQARLQRQQQANIDSDTTHEQNDIHDMNGTSDGQAVRESETAEEKPLPSRPLPEQIKGFLEYLSLLVTLRRDGANRQSGDTGDEEAADVIRVMTVHASKGLEFPVVYLPGLVQRRFPMQPRPGPVAAPEGMLPPESEGHQAHESGEACLFYVGITRARDQLILSYSERYGKISYKRSHYLDALQAGIPEDRLAKSYWNTPLPSESPTGPAGLSSSPIPFAGPTPAFIAAMKDETLHISTIEAYLRCPRQYVYRSIYHFSGEEGAFRLFLQATQKTLEELRQHRQQTQQAPQAQNAASAKSAFTQEQLRERYSQHWRALGGETVPFASMYEQHGQEVVALLQKELDTHEYETWSMQHDYSVEIAGKTVHLSVDRVDESSQAETPTKFVRTRFGKRKEPPTPETRELLYAHAYRQRHPGQPVELHNHNLSTGERTPITISPRKEKSLRAELEQALQGLESNHYPAQPAEPSRCPTCPFFFICPS